MIVKDPNGIVINGLQRTRNGGLLVNNPDEFNKYMKEKTSKEEIMRLTNEVQQLKDLVLTLLREKNG